MKSSHKGIVEFNGVSTGLTSTACSAMVCLDAVRHVVLNDIVNELRQRGLWVERHSFSFRVMFRDRIVASFHVYPIHRVIDVRLYSGRASVDDMVLRNLEEVFRKKLPCFKVNVHRSTLLVFPG